MPSELDKEFKEELLKSVRAAKRARDVMSQLKPGEFWIEVVPTYFDAQQALRALGMIGVESGQGGVLALAVLPQEQPGGELVWLAQDIARNKDYRLETVTEAAVLFVPSDTVPLMNMKQAHWLHRVRQGMAAEGLSKPSGLLVLIAVILATILLITIVAFFASGGG